MFAIPRRFLLLGSAVVLAGAFFSIRQLMQNTPPEAPESAAPLFLDGTPAGALNRYVEGDFQGERLQRANWETVYKKRVLWTNEPLWDSAYVIRSYRVQSGKMTLYAAEGDVTYDTLGELSLETFEYTPSPSRQTVHFDLTSQKRDWKIAMPTLRPHISPEAAVAHLQRMAAGYPQRKAMIDQAIARIQADAQAQQ